MSSTTAKAALAIGAAAIITWLVWPRPAMQPESAPPAAATPAISHEPAAPGVPASDPGAEISDLKGRLAEETRARVRAESEATALSGQIAPLKGKVIVSLGRVEDIGKRFGAFLPAFGELHRLSSREPDTLSPGEKRRLLELQRDHAKLLGALPEITNFQDQPDEYGRFFSSTL